MHQLLLQKPPGSPRLKLFRVKQFTGGSGAPLELQKRINTLPSGNTTLSSFFSEEDGVGVVEIILILVVLISLVIIFKNQLTSLVTSILQKITEQSNSV